MVNKICSKCKTEKNICDFSKDKNNKDGLQTQCKRCKQEYRLNNKEKYSELTKNWMLVNLNKGKEYYQNSIEYQKSYHESNKIKRLNNMRKYYNENKIVLLEKQKEYASKNKLNRNIKEKNRRENDKLYSLTISIRNLIGESFKHLKLRKNSRTEQILGCSFEEFKVHLESQFADWMNWGNKGNPKDGILELNKTWDIDHIIPLSSAKSEEDIIKLNHYSNLQPLCSYINRYIKRNIL